MKIGDIQQAHRVDGQQDHGGPGGAHVLENGFVEQQTNVAAAIDGIELASQAAEEIGVQAQASRTRQYHGDRPRPALAEAIEFVNQETESEYERERWQQISGHAQSKETSLRQPRADQAHEIMSRIINLRAIERQVTLVVRE